MGVKDRPPPKWFVWSWPTGREVDDAVPPVPDEERFESMDLALDHVIALVSVGGQEWIKLFHLVEHDCRVRWRDGRYVHAVPYAQSYIKERNGATV